MASCELARAKKFWARKVLWNLVCPINETSSVLEGQLMSSEANSVSARQLVISESSSVSGQPVARESSSVSGQPLTRESRSYQDSQWLPQLSLSSLCDPSPSHFGSNLPPSSPSTTACFLSESVCKVESKPIGVFMFPAPVSIVLCRWCPVKEQLSLSESFICPPAVVHCAKKFRPCHAASHFELVSEHHKPSRPPLWKWPDFIDYFDWAVFLLDTTSTYFLLWCSTSSLLSVLGNRISEINQGLKRFCR